MAVAAAPASPEPEASPARNEVILWGRLSVPAEERTLPSGDTIVTLRVVIPRHGARRGDGSVPPRTRRETRKGEVDTIEVVCWTAATRRAALRLSPGALVEVEGALRRRFFGSAGGRQSRYEVEAWTLRRVAGALRVGT